MPASARPTARPIVASASRARRARKSGGRCVARASIGRAGGDADAAGTETRARARWACATLSACAIVLGLGAPNALAGLNKAGNADAYAEMMRAMEAERAAANAPAMSAESLFKEGGGACGDGYELRVQKVLGASCVCVREPCDDAGRKVRTEAERSFGKQQEAPAEDAAAGGSGIKFTFSNNE